MAEIDNREYAGAAREILENLLRVCGFEVGGIEEVEDGDQLEFRVATEDSGRLIGRTCQTLDAIQFLLNRLMSRRFGDAPYCVVDVAEYRARRKEKLVADAMAALEQVRQTGRACRMPLLNSMDRRVIHKALLPYEDVETHSEDADFSGRKRVVITPVRGAVRQEAAEAASVAAEPENPEIPEIPENPEATAEPDIAGEPPAPPAEEAAGPEESERAE